MNDPRLQVLSRGHSAPTELPKGASSRGERQSQRWGLG